MSENDILQSLYEVVLEMKTDMSQMKTDMQEMKSDISGLKSEMKTVNERLTKLELTLENEINHSIQLLAENHIDLVEKLNKAIHVQDKSILYEVQVSGLKMKVEQLERDVQDIKSRIA